MNFDEDPNIFEYLSCGRWLDLGSRLTPEEIEFMANHMKRTCPDCQGEGFHGILGIETPAGIFMMPIPCELCEGEGEAMYICHN